MKKIILDYEKKKQLIFGCQIRVIISRHWLFGFMNPVEFQDLINLLGNCIQSLQIIFFMIFITELELHFENQFNLKKIYRLLSMD